MQTVTVKIAEKFRPLLTEHYRNKLYYGGRAGGKSYAFADSLLLIARSKKVFIACVREVQESIKDSVYKLLKDRAEYYGFDDFVFYEDRVENVVTGSRFIFKGLHDTVAENIKSLEGVDICWIEEAQKISKKSWKILEPTIRKEGSEIWISMNRDKENDPIWQAVAAHPDERTLVCRINYDENPYCPEEMVYLAEKCKREDPDEYDHTWMGAPVYAGNRKLIAAKDVRNAMEPKMDKSDSPLIIGVDVARFGDDKTVFCYRRGRWCYKIEAFSNLDNVQVANKITSDIFHLKPARVFIDIGGIGSGVYDILNDRGYGKIVRGINFGAKAIYDDRYVNKRAEMWGEANQWLKSDLPVQLPKDDELFDELCSVEKDYDTYGRLKLASKEEVKKDLLRSPDKADAFVLTFAEPVFDNGSAQMYGNGNVSIETMFADAARRNRSNGW